MLDTKEYQQWADSQYDILGATAYGRVSALLRECDRLVAARATEQAAVRHQATEIIRLTGGAGGR